MTTARALIKQAFRKAKILSVGQSPTAEEFTDALVTINDFLGEWSNDGLSVNVLTTEAFSLVGGTASYSIGSGQTFNTTRPMRIETAYVRVGTLDSPVRPLTDREYAEIGYKSQQSTYPEFLHFNNGYPYAQIDFWPVPASNYSVYLVTEKPLSPIASLDTTLSFPPGWEKAIKAQLVCELAPEYGQDVDQNMLREAQNAKRAIRKAVLRNRPINVTPPGRAGNIYTGWV
jgi:hypothetical protein